MSTLKSDEQNSLQNLNLSYRPAQFQLPSNGEEITSELTGITYKIGELIGEGAFGIVFSCYDIWGNELVAKVFKPNGCCFEEIEGKAFDELVALVHLRHPNIMYVYDGFIYNGACYIISERCTQTLEEMISHSDFQPDIWFPAISRCILQAIYFAHTNNVAHCDIHTGNVFIHFSYDEILPNEQSASTFKLGDFGLARSLDAVSSDGTFLNLIRPPEVRCP